MPCVSPLDCHAPLRRLKFFSHRRVIALPTDSCVVDSTQRSDEIAPLLIRRCDVIGVYLLLGAHPVCHGSVVDSSSVGISSASANDVTVVPPLLALESRWRFLDTYTVIECALVSCLQDSVVLHSWSQAFVIFYLIYFFIRMYVCALASGLFYKLGGIYFLACSDAFHVFQFSRSAHCHAVVHAWF